MEEYLLKICGAALLCAIAGLVLEKAQGGIGAAVRIGGLCLIFGVAAGLLSDAHNELFSMSQSMEIGEYASVMLKALGISVLCRISSDMCRACKEETLGGVVEGIGRISMVLLAMPIVKDVIAFALRLVSE